MGAVKGLFGGRKSSSEPAVVEAGVERDELDPQVHAAITAFCADGDALADTGDYAGALSVYNQAWALIPEPQNHWNASTWVLAAIGDVCFLGGFPQSARQALDYVMSCPDAIGNPFLHLRRGQVCFDAGELDEAADELTRAYALAGPEIFETEDAKYLTFLRSRITLDGAE